MDSELTDSQLKNIVLNLMQSETEREHFEFKVNNTSEETMAKNISAITNSLIRYDYPRGYIIWGIDDIKHKVVGTSFKPYSEKVSNEDLILWLAKYVKPTPQIIFREIQIENKRVVVLVIRNDIPEISRFKREAYIRIGSNTRSLREFPNIEHEIWKKIMARDFESDIAYSDATKEDVYNLLDLDTLYALRSQRAVIAKENIFDEAINSRLIKDNRDSTYNITNLGALLYAKNLSTFPHLQSKIIRIVKYNGSSKLNIVSERRNVGGYVVEFHSLYNYILSQVIKEEMIDQNDGIRRPEYLYPPLSIRELFANIIMHPDFTDNSLHPMVEIFSDRIEFTNPGEPIVPIERFIDFPPRSRNQQIANELYKAGISESLGSGWDKVAEESSTLGFPAPKPEVMPGVTRVTLSQKRALSDMTTEDRIWTVYIYTCLLWTQHTYLTNTHVRKLFNIPDGNMSTASAIIAQTVKAGLIKIFDEKAGTRSRKYWPTYAEYMS